MEKQRIHTSQSDNTNLHQEEHYVDENLRSIQTIAGGGPPKIADLKAMPLMVRMFGYVIIAIIVLMGLTAVAVSFM